MVSNRGDAGIVRRVLARAIEIVPMCEEDILADRRGTYKAIATDLLFGLKEIREAGGVEDDFCTAAAVRVSETAFAWHLDRYYKRNMWGRND